MARPGGHQHQSIRQNLAPGGSIVDERELLLQQNPFDRAFRPAIRALAGRVRRLSPVGWIESLAHRLQMAGIGRRGAVERVLALKLVLGLVGVGVGLWLIATTASTTNIIVSVLGVVFLYMLPDLVFLSRGRERQTAIQSELPDTLDQMTISVEAGLGFDAALRRVSEAGEGPLAKELRHTVREISLGLSRRDAFRHLVDRTDVDELRQFAFAVQHADEYGLPIAQVLRTQAADLRVRRRQRAEEAALKIPVKLLFPLVFCIFPTIFIVLLAPAVMRILGSF
jgi:tight adherence protein C